MEITEIDQLLLDWVMLYGIDGEVKYRPVDDYRLTELWVKDLMDDLTPSKVWSESIFQLNQRAKNRLKEIQDEY